jgi:hypothetical protein
LEQIGLKLLHSKVIGVRFQFNIQSLKLQFFSLHPSAHAAAKACTSSKLSSNLISVIFRS